MRNGKRMTGMHIYILPPCSMPAVRLLNPAGMGAQFERSWCAISRGILTENPPDFGDSDSVLAFLYEAYNESHNMDDTQTKADFRALYQAMNGRTLSEMDTILDPVCALCRDHQRSGFIGGIRIGVCLREELTEK